MEAKLTSYWFDRFAFDTDIGPIVAAYQKNGISGVWSLIKSMAPISGANVLALNTEVDDIFGNILKERGIEIDAPKEKQDIVYKIVKAILSPVFDGLVSGKNAVKGAFTGKGSQESMRFRNNQMWLNNVMGSYIEEETNPAKDNTISYECYNDPSKIIETLEGIKKGINTTFGIDQDLSGVQMKLDIGGKNKNLFGVILYMLILEKHHLDKFELKDKEKIESLIDSILNTNKFDFTKVIQALEFQKGYSVLIYREQNLEGLLDEKRDINVGDVVEFLDKKVDQVDFARDLAETHFENVINSLIAGRKDEEDFGTLNLSIKKESSLKGNPKSIASSILKNMEFLRYLENDLEEEGIEDIFKSGLENLKENINKNLKTQTIDQSFSKLLRLLDKNKDKDRIIEFYAKYVDPECTKSYFQNHIESEIVARKKENQESPEDTKKSFFKLSDSDYDLGEEEKFNDLDVYRNIELLMYLQETDDDTFESLLKKFIKNLSSEKKFRVSPDLFQTIARNIAKGNGIEQLINLRRIERFYNEFVATEDNSLEKIKITNIEEVKKKGLIDKLKSLDVKWLNHIFEATGYINEKVDHSVEGLLHFLEAKFGKNSAEVIIMILLVQSPFIEPLIKTLKSVIGTLLAPFPKAVRKYAVGFVTYLFSMFADNYIGEIVGVDLLTDPSIGLGAEEGKGMDINEAIGFAGSLAIIGGSADLLGNAPHAIIETYKKWYGTSSNEGGQEIDYEKADGLLHKIMGVMGDILGDVVSVGAAASDPVSAPGIGGLIFQSMKPNLQKMYDISAENGATEGFCSPFGRYIGGVVDAFKPPPKTSST